MASSSVGAEVRARGRAALSPRRRIGCGCPWHGASGRSVFPVKVEWRETKELDRILDGVLNAARPMAERRRLGRCGLFRGRRGRLVLRACSARCRSTAPPISAARIARRIGPHLGASKRARINLARAMPELSSGGDRAHRPAACGTISAASSPNFRIWTSSTFTRPAAGFESIGTARSSTIGAHNALHLLLGALRQLGDRHLGRDPGGIGGARDLPRRQQSVHRRDPRRMPEAPPAPSYRPRAASRRGAR